MLSVTMSSSVASSIWVTVARHTPRRTKDSVPRQRFNDSTAPLLMRNGVWPTRQQLSTTFLCSTVIMHQFLLLSTLLATALTNLSVFKTGGSWNRTIKRWRNRAGLASLGFGDNDHAIRELMRFIEMTSMKFIFEDATRIGGAPDYKCRWLQT